MLRLLRTLGSIVLLAGLAVFLIAQEDGCNSDENGEGTGDTTPVAETATPEQDTDGGETGETTAPYSEDDPEYQLAVIDAGGFVPLDDPSIDTYAGLLDSLDAKCSEERSLIGDQAVRATQLLAEEGISVSALEALQGIDGSIPGELPGLTCAEIAAAWVVLVIAQ